LHSSRLGDRKRRSADEATKPKPSCLVIEYYRMLVVRARAGRADPTVVAIADDSVWSAGFLGVSFRRSRIPCAAPVAISVSVRRRRGGVWSVLGWVWSRSGLGLDSCPCPCPPSASSLQSSLQPPLVHSSQSKRKRVRKRIRLALYVALALCCSSSTRQTGSTAMVTTTAHPSDPAWWKEATVYQGVFGRRPTP
jgi:hypothetical protein